MNWIGIQHALLQMVVEACVKKRHCKFSTTPNNGESAPCPDQSKFVEVAYKCRPLEFRSKIICENETINLKCKRNARIAIYSATFGRTHYQSLQCPQTPGVEEESNLYFFYVISSSLFYSCLKCITMFNSKTIILLLLLLTNSKTILLILLLLLLLLLQLLLLPTTTYYLPAYTYSN